MVNGLHIVFDCADVDKVSRFWLSALDGYDYPGSDPDGPPGSPPAGFASWEEWADANDIPDDQRYTARTIVDTVGNRPDIFFLAVPEPKSVENRVHLDVKVAVGLSGAERRQRIEAVGERLVAAGGSIVRRMDDDEGLLVVMQDPEGNEFCVG